MSNFLQDLIDQQRAGDTYGQLDRLADEHMLRPFLVSRENKNEIAVNCDVDAATEARLRSFYQAVAAGIERATGRYTTVVLDLSHEGFGRVIVFAGRLVVVSDVLRDAQRFGFASPEKLAARGDQLVAAGIEAIDRFKEAAGDES
ncbi:NifX-associated nitrogen fixation protein [Candidatus Mycolicibacterium alkanivorans]|uniref:NifX-associated nitrogen fixation protein n=1 Tax=Candidatus Mycolicibacterium alkanivorans TaxID=2954114 RepID=A0ABS9YQV0_9MYCO|nr:NifX-associated nitrogen fixation protein [Candidatus Mycolicibacterium alkanivorans]MCI4673635.1 NifX-associated nitrogen fixation protein [Candidatus Mycolicibacterium alkanivorans]